ncbi:MAG: hypothetical protein O3A49_04435 [Candidatus Marinimicrobia bacterium]|nr:hypothetical protein [Candidatus Neomarinimicrobiota bacterium]
MKTNKTSTTTKKTKEKAMPKADIAETISVQEIKKAANVAISTYHESFGATFDTGHISKMSSLVKPSDMFVDYTYQRKALDAKVKKIVKNFSPDLLGIITCSMREDNQLAIIDGSHRYHALIAMGMENSNVNALVYFGLSIQDEARIFTLTNKEHTKPNPSQIFKAGIVSGDEISVAIYKIIEKVGASISEGPGVNKVRAVSTLRKIYTNAGAEVLTKTLQTLSDAFPNNNETYHGQLLSAVGCIYRRYGDQVDQKRLAKVLGMAGSPAMIIAQAQSMISNGQTITFTSLPFAIVNRYNVKMKSNRLPDFPMNLLPHQIWAKA